MQVITKINEGLNILQSKTILKNHQGKSSHPCIKSYSLVIIIHVLILVIKLEIVEHTTRMIIKVILKTLEGRLQVDKIESPTDIIAQLLHFEVQYRMLSMSQNWSYNLGLHKWHEMGS